MSRGESKFVMIRSAGSWPYMIGRGGGMLMFVSCLGRYTGKGVMLGLGTVDMCPEDARVLGRGGGVLNTQGSVAHQFTPLSHSPKKSYSPRVEWTYFVSAGLLQKA